MGGEGEQNQKERVAGNPGEKKSARLEATFTWDEGDDHDKGRF